MIELVWEDSLQDFPVELVWEDSLRKLRIYTRDPVVLRSYLDHTRACSVNKLEFQLNSFYQRLYNIDCLSETTYVTTPKVVEAKLGEHAEFSLTYTTPDNTSEFSVLRLGANGTDVVLRVVELNVTTNPNWTMSANVGVSVVGGDTRKVNITLYSVDYNVHEGEYIARVTGSDGDGQDFFKIRTLGKFAYCFVKV